MEGLPPFQASPFCSGYQPELVTLVAKNKAAALHQLTTVFPDLILFDLGLPGGDGVAVVQAIRADAQTAHIPVIIVSAQHEQIPSELRPYISAILPKPVEIPVLLHHVHAALAP